MPDYQPTSRRPIADALRRTAGGAVRFCVRRGIHPDAISYASMPAAGAAAACFWLAESAPWLLLLAPLFCYLRLWLNMLDGMVALAAGKASKRGEILNELPDRVSDLVIFAGVAHSGLCAPPIAYWAAIAALLTAYAGTLGQAVAGHREFGGVMAKPHRMVALHIGAWVAFFITRREESGLSVLDWTCLAVIAGCLQTIAVRLNRTLRRLRDEARA
jgi:phosphatidylglycerophosphate synthase